MTCMREGAAANLGLLQDVITFLLSWLALAAIAIIVSGKLIAKRMPLGLNDDALFRMPLIFFDLRARNDEVSLGLISFILSLAVCIGLGGKSAYLFFRENAGIDVGQWNSLCV